MTLRDVARSARRLAQLSPMQRVMRGIARHGVQLGGLDALEMFGGTGIYHTVDYASKAASLEAWEIDPERAREFARNLPEARVRIGDTYALAADSARRFGLIVADNPMSVHGDHAEHFDLVPLILHLAADDAVVIINVIPAITPRGIRRFPFIDNPVQRAARAAFYRCSTPDNIPFDAITATFDRLASEAGFDVEWRFFVRRHVVYYLALKLRRRTTGPTP